MARRKIISPTFNKNFVTGFTAPWTTMQVVDLLQLTDYNHLTAFFAGYHLDHIRFPGGQSSRWFFYDDFLKTDGTGDWISDEANDILDVYYPSRDFADITDRTPTSPWQLYLKLCNNSAIQPIFTLNTVFYLYNSTLYPIEELNRGSYEANGIFGLGLDSDRWTNKRKIQAYIQQQIKQAHTLYNGNIKWEIGSENHTIYDPAIYAFIVYKFGTWIKALYPNDKILVSMSKGALSSDNNDQWNTDFLVALDGYSMLNNVDYFVVHWYPGKLLTNATLAYFTGDTPIQADIDTRVEDTYFNDTLMAGAKGYFSTYSPYVPKFSLTEFNLLEDGTPYKDTQLHALLMIDGLMKFKKESNLLSVTKHTGNGLKNGAFYLNNTTRVLNFAYTLGDPNDSIDFPYIAPHAKAMAIFSDHLGDTYDSYSLNDTDNGLEILITKTGTTGYVHILNYKGVASTGFDTSNYNGSTATIWTFPALANYSWDEVANKAIDSPIGDTLDLPAYSFTSIEVLGLFA